MSVKIVKVQSGDYKLVVGSVNPQTGIPSAGNITFDTNPTGQVGDGKVTIKGDLEVLGTTTTVNTETVTIEDNILDLNFGWNGSTTPGRTSGLWFNQGPSNPDIHLVWELDVLSTDPSGNTNAAGNPDGTFVFKDGSNNLRAISTNSINAAPTKLGPEGWSQSSDLAIKVGSDKVVRIVDSGPYEQRVLDYSKLFTVLTISITGRLSNIATITTTTAHNLIPGNIIDVFCTSNASFNGSFVTVSSTPTPTSFTYSNSGFDVTAGPSGSATGTVKVNAVRDANIIPNMRAVADYAFSSLSSYVSNRIQENDTKVQTYDFDTSGVSKISFEVDGTQKAFIDNFGMTFGNIQITTNGISNISNDNIIIDNVLNIQNRVSTPSTPVGYVKLYSKNAPGNGGTGLFFVNTTGTNDELISKTRALLISLII